MRARWRTGLVSAVLTLAAALAVPGASSAGSAGLTAMPAGTQAMWLWGDQPAADVVTWAASRGVSEIRCRAATTARSPRRARPDSPKN
jgi:hypothetical protein